MARTMTLADLRTMVTDEAMVAGQGDLSRARVTAAINRSLSWWWLSIVGSGEGYGESEIEVVATAGTATIQYPDGMQQIRGLLRPTTGTDGGYLAAAHLQRPVYADAVGQSYDDKRLLNLPGVYWYESDLASIGVPPNPPAPIVDLIHLRPEPVVAEVIKVIAIEQTPVLAQETDLVRVDPGWEHPIVSYAVYRLLRPADQSLAQDFKREATEGLQSTILAWRNRRDSNGPDNVHKFRRRTAMFGRRSFGTPV